MFLAKEALLGVLIATAVLLGGASAAWRRACVRITRAVVGIVDSKLVATFTPHFVAVRHVWALRILLLAGVAALVMFNWEVAVVTLVLTYLLMELTGFLYPSRNNPYYLTRMIQDLETMQRIHTHFGETAEAEDVKRRLEVVLSAVRAGDLGAG